MRHLIPSFSRLAVAAVLLLGLAACDPTTGVTADPGTHKPTGASAGDALDQLRGLKVDAGGTMAGYSRAKFHIWAGQGGGCDTRDVVLKRDGKDVKATDQCKITSGTWISPYNLKSYTDPLSLDIDHIVPLGNSWISGTAAWTDDQRKAFANDLTRPQLLAVDLTNNRAKGDQDPSHWKPPNHDFWCAYATDWVSVKSYWKLTVTAAEKSALNDMLETCS